MTVCNYEGLKMAFELAAQGKSDREVATPGGFEPPISTVTGWHVYPLHHGAILIKSF